MALKQVSTFSLLEEFIRICKECLHRCSVNNAFDLLQIEIIFNAIIRKLHAYNRNVTSANFWGDVSGCRGKKEAERKVRYCRRKVCIARNVAH